MSTFGLPIQHVLDDELFVLKTEALDLFNEAPPKDVFMHLTDGLIDIVLDAHALNNYGNIQKAVLQTDCARYLFEAIVESALLDEKTPADAKEKRVKCAAGIALSLMQELPQNRRKVR